MAVSAEDEALELFGAAALCGVRAAGRDVGRAELALAGLAAGLRGGVGLLVAITQN
jgi:hypothetical protein